MSGKTCTLNCAICADKIDATDAMTVFNDGENVVCLSCEPRLDESIHVLKIYAKGELRNGNHCLCRSIDDAFDLMDGSPEEYDIAPDTISYRQFFELGDFEGF